jgi:hypothetical protein
MCLIVTWDIAFTVLAGVCLRCLAPAAIQMWIAAATRAASLQKPMELPA